MAGGNVACACSRSSQGERRIFDDRQLGRRRIEQLLDLFQVINQGFADIYSRRFAVPPLGKYEIAAQVVSHRNSVNDPVFQGAGNAGRNTVHDLVGKSGAVHFQNASFVIGRRHEFGQDQLFNVRFTHGAGDDLFPEGFQLVNVPDGNGSFVKMVFGPYSAAVVNGNIRMGGLLNGLAEKGAYGDVRDFFSGDAHLLVEKRISGKSADNFLYFRVIGNFLIQRNGPG